VSASRDFFFFAVLGGVDWVGGGWGWVFVWGGPWGVGGIFWVGVGVWVGVVGGGGVGVGGCWFFGGGGGGWPFLGVRLGGGVGRG